jgi:hypothetical protein
MKQYYHSVATNQAALASLAALMGLKNFCALKLSLGWIDYDLRFIILAVIHYIEIRKLHLKRSTPSKHYQPRSHVQPTHRAISSTFEMNAVLLLPYDLYQTMSTSPSYHLTTLIIGLMTLRRPF